MAAESPQSAVITVRIHNKLIFWDRNKIMNRITYWVVVSAILFALFLIVPRTMYALEGEYCCSPEAEACLLILAPCDIRYAWAAKIIFANAVLSVLAFTAIKIRG